MWGRAAQRQVISSEKSQFLGDETNRLRGGLSKKGYDISDYDISDNKYISETL